MALQDILQKIKQEAETELKALEEEHDKKLKTVDEEFEDLKAEANEDMDDKVETNSKKIMNKMTTIAKMEAKNKLLKEKRELLDEIFEEALAKLVDSPNYKDLIVGLLKHAGISGEDVEVVPAKGKESETKSALEASGKSFKMSEKAGSIKGGFILVSDKIEINNSFESILNKQLRSDLELEIAKTLFA